MINDLNKALKFNNGFLYVGNTKIVVTGQNLQSVSIKVNKDLQTLSQWLIDNKLTLNVKKQTYDLSP